MFANKQHELAHETLKAGNVEKAIALYSKALEEAPDHCDILNDRAVAYLHLEQQESCMADFDRALELQPNYSYRYACRAFAKNRFGDINGAVEDYQKAVELDPDDAVAHNNLGLLLEQKGYQKEADERFERADKLSKMEDNLYDVMDELENKPNETVTKEINSEQEEKGTESASQEFKKVFTSKKQFREFVNFVKNGFKLK